MVEAARFFFIQWARKNSKSKIWREMECKKMSLIIGCLLGFFFVLMILEIAVNWQINASQYED